MLEWTSSCSSRDFLVCDFLVDYITYILCMCVRIGDRGKIGEVLAPRLGK